ncbi:glycosyltransferase [Vagococcus lutrae]|uniref:glycosyltransferase n=1 Tax=Vagococcus lutrae TaxID=81947 RepID=UPI002890C798|nr:glycosyltransferase [Vagococcus lutrae]MDT2811544.1 glycosyltransferase [Vagococcus lutrae]
MYNKVLFVHDGPIKKDEENNIYGLAHNDEVFSRYFQIAEKVDALIRVESIDKKQAQKNFSQITIPNFNVHESPNISNFKNITKNLKNIKKNIENIVITYDFLIIRLPSMIGLITVDIAKKNDIPYLIELVACPWDGYWNHSFKGKIIAPYLFFRYKKIVRESENVLYVTEEFLQRRYQNNKNNVGCSDAYLIERDIKKIFEDRKNKIESYNHNTIYKIGTVASVSVKYKGQDRVIKALARLKKEGKTNYQYYLIGGGNQERLKELSRKLNVEEQVKFLGSIPHNEINKVLKNLDIYIQPSKQEGLPRSVVEAMGSGLPVIGANTGGIPELISEKMIFKNNIFYVRNIYNMLKNLNKTILIEESKNNILKSQFYIESKLDEKRKKYYESLLMLKNRNV